MTRTPAGARLIAERLASPLTEPAEIIDRQDAVQFFVEAPALREDLRKTLSATPDFLRALVAPRRSTAAARAISRPCAKASQRARRSPRAWRGRANCQRRS